MSNLIKDGKVVGSEDIKLDTDEDIKGNIKDQIYRLNSTSERLEKVILGMGGELVEPEAIRDIVIKYNPSVARAVRRNGQLTRIHPFRLKINNEEIEINERIIDIINTLILEI